MSNRVDFRHDMYTFGQVAKAFRQSDGHDLIVTADQRWNDATYYTLSLVAHREGTTTYRERWMKFYRDTPADLKRLQSDYFLVLGKVRDGLVPPTAPPDDIAECAVCAGWGGVEVGIVGHDEGEQRACEACGATGFQPWWTEVTTS